MKPSIEIIGVYPVIAFEPVHLIELLIKNSNGPLKFEQITQEILDQPKSNWQVPYDEKILDHTGTKIIADPFMEKVRSELWRGDFRLVFFFHYLDFTKKLKTPFGDITLPLESEKPQRLSEINYEAP